MAAPTKLELSVQMTCQSCIDSIKSALTGVDGVKLTGIDLDVQRVLVETIQPSAMVIDLIESTGRRAVLLGLGTASETSVGAAVAMMSGGGAQGVIRMVQTDDVSSTCVIEGTVDGLSPGLHRLAIHQYGDISEGCTSCGDVFNMLSSSDQGKTGDLGHVTADTAGRAQFRLIRNGFNVWDVVGRSMVMHETSNNTPEGDTRLACGIIAHSSGLFENTKRICACDGVTLWDERDVPLAGAGRRRQQPQAQL